VLKDAIEVALNKMAKDKGDEPSKKIPEGFYEFASSSGYKDLLEAMLDYNRVSYFKHILISYQFLTIIGAIQIGK